MELIRKTVGVLLDEVPRHAKIKRSAYQKQGVFPIVDQSQSFIAGYTDDEEWLYRGKLPIIIFGDHTRVLKFIKFPFCIGADGTQLLRPIKGIEIRFFYYSLRNIDLTNYGYERHFKYLKEEEIEIPSPATQHRVGSILSAYDELIENCQRRIRILDEMARGLYREWFVRFRFPGNEQVPRVDSPLGPIPKGWEVRNLGELADQMRRNVGKGELDVPEPYVGLEHIPRRSLALDAWETTCELGSNKLGFKKGEVLFGKIRPYFHKVSVAPFDGLCSADTIVVRARRSEHYAFVVACVSSDAFVSEASATANGAKMPRANWHVLERFKIVIPSDDIATRFSAFLKNVLSQQQTLILKIQNLRRTRDLLLPRLLSGQVPLDVSAVEGTAKLTVAAPPYPAPPLFFQTDLASEEPALRAAEEPSPYRVERAGHGVRRAEPADEAPGPIDQIDRTEVLQVIRQVFSEGPPRERDTAIRDVARALGYRRTGPRIQEILHTDLMTAVRRCILDNEKGALHLYTRSISDYDRDFLKQQFLAAIGRIWIDRGTATREFGRWLGFARIGPIIEDTARSLINGLLREDRLEADANLIRKKA